jgi:hypothetical protein
MSQSTTNTATSAVSPSAKLAEIQRLRKKLLERIVRNETRRKTDAK